MSEGIRRTPRRLEVLRMETTASVACNSCIRGEAQVQLAFGPPHLRTVVHLCYGCVADASLGINRVLNSRPTL